MNYSVKFDIKKCAELKIPAEALEFWDKGIGNEFLYSKFYEYITYLSSGDQFIMTENFEKRNLMKDFSTAYFIIQKRVHITEEGFKYLKFYLIPTNKEYN